MNMTISIQVLHVVGIHKGTHWELIGVFDDIKKALAACTTENHFIGPVILNTTAPDETIDWPGLIYPKALQNEH